MSEEIGNAELLAELRATLGQTREAFEAITKLQERVSKLESLIMLYGRCLQPILDATIRLKTGMPPGEDLLK